MIEKNIKQILLLDSLDTNVVFVYINIIQMTRSAEIFSFL